MDNNETDILNRYSEKCISDRLDPEYARAVMNAIRNLKVLRDTIEFLRDENNKLYSGWMKISQQLYVCDNKPNEYIRRKDVVDLLEEKIEKARLWKLKYGDIVEVISGAKKMIEEYPFKDVYTDVAEVKHGEWVNGKCSECGGAAPFWSMATTYYRSNFCQNCGARMDKDGDGDV